MGLAFSLRGEPDNERIQTMIFLNEDEALDLQATLQSAIHALTYPTMFPENAAIVERLRAWYDATLSDQQRARRADMRDRLHALRDAQGSDATEPTT